MQFTQSEILSSVNPDNEKEYVNVGNIYLIENGNDIATEIYYRTPIDPNTGTELPFEEDDLLFIKKGIVSEEGIVKITEYILMLNKKKLLTLNDVISSFGEEGSTNHESMFLLYFKYGLKVRTNDAFACFIFLDQDIDPIYSKHVPVVRTRCFSSGYGCGVYRTGLSVSELNKIKEVLDIQ